MKEGKYNMSKNTGIEFENKVFDINQKWYQYIMSANRESVFV